MKTRLVLLIRYLSWKIRNRKKPKAAEHFLEGQTKLHLACGKNILKEWANIDLVEAKGVIKHDLTLPLPIQSRTIKFIFNEHFIEHITRDEAVLFLKECHRVLLPKGILRISTPNLKKLIDEYLLERLSEWTDVGFCPTTPCRMVNDGMRLWGHKFLYDVNELENLLKECGFKNITHMPWCKSKYPELDNLECRPFHGEIIVEASKQ